MFLNRQKCAPKKIHALLIGVIVSVSVIVFENYTAASRTLRMLQKYIPEDLSHAQYVQLGCQGSSRNLSGLTVGTAWLIRNGKDSESEFLINGCEHVRLYDKNILAGQRKKSSFAKAEAQRPWSYYQGYLNGKLGGEWIDVDLDTDISLVISGLRGKTESFWDKVFNDASIEENTRLARLLLFAVNVAQTGNKAASIQIIRQLFKSGNKKKIIQEALNQIAEGRYAGLCRTLSESGNRAAFLFGLKSLVSEFGDQWTRKTAIERQIMSMQNNQTSMPHTEEEKAFLATIDTQGLSDLRFISWWILPNSDQSPKTKSHQAVDVLLNKRLDAFPFLIRLLDDYTPTSLSLHDYEGLTGPGYMCTTGWRYPDPILMTTIYDPLDLLPRPVTRAEIARGLLSSAIWLSDDQQNSLFDTEWYVTDHPFIQYKTMVQAWYNIHKDKSDLALCQEFLRSANTEPHPVIAYLLNHGNSNDIEIIEKKLQKNVHAYNAYRIIASYINMRGMQAKSFLDTYEKTVLSNGGMASKKESLNNLSPEDQIRLLRIIKDLRALMEGTLSTQSILKELTSNQVQWNDACEAYWSSLKLAPPETGLLVALNTSLQTADYSLRDSIVNSAVNNAIDFIRSTATNMPREAIKNYLTPDHIAAWKRLLDDTRIRCPELSTAGELAASLENLVELKTDDYFKNYSRLNQLIQQLGDVASERFIARAYDRLNGKPSDELTPIPNPIYVSEERRNTIAEQFRKATIADHVMAHLNLDEKLALPEIMQSDTALNHTLLPYANRIVDVELKNPLNAGLSTALLNLKGQVLNTNIIQTIVNLCMKEAQNGHSAYGKISRKSLLRGVSIELKIGLPEKSTASRNAYPLESCLAISMDREDERIAFAMLPFISSNMVDRVSSNTTKEQNTRQSYEFGPYDEAAKAYLWKVITMLVNTDYNVAESSEIILNARDHLY